MIIEQNEERTIKYNELPPFIVNMESSQSINERYVRWSKIILMEVIPSSIYSQSITLKTLYY